MKGASGILGDVVVYREFRGKLIMSNRPNVLNRLPQGRYAGVYIFIVSNID